MRLFNVHTETFTTFYSDVPAYVIASHRWIGSTETSFQDVRKQRNTHKEGYRKLEGFVKYIKTHVLHVEWLWIDTCCINKRDAAELSEAINSMYKWYKNAEVCLAYLADVAKCDDDDELQQSKWFERGWTLQELIAPKTVVFLTRDWKVIGHKGAHTTDDSNNLMPIGRSLVPLIVLRTGIPEAVLADPGRLVDFNNEEKLKWAESRSTSREEDMSYCLFGIFNVFLPPIYGEGRQSARRRLLAEVGRTDTAFSQPQPSHNLPFRRDVDYVAREELMNQLSTRLSQPAGRAAMVGLGGVGKSQLAIEYSLSLRTRSPDIWVLWIHASNAARFKQSVQDVAELLKIPGRYEENSDLPERLWRWLRDDRNGAWLVVLDNADDTGFLLEPPVIVAEQKRKRRIDYFPVCDHGSLLITSRNRKEALKLVNEQDIIDVMPMSEGEAEKLLINKLGKRSPEDLTLVRALDCMPLAVTQAAAFIRERGLRCSVRQYCEEIEKSRRSRTSLLGKDIPLQSRDREARNAVILTWQISFEHLYQTERSAAELLSIMSLCDRVSIPEMLIRADGEDVNTAISLSVFDDDIITLRSFSFVSETADAQTWEMHRLVQDATQVWLGERELFEEALGHLVHRMSNIFPTSDFENWPLCRTLLPHAVNLISCQPISKERRVEWALVMYNAACFALDQGDYSSASRMAKSSLAARSLNLGEDDALTLQSKEMVAETYRNQGRWEEAEQLFMELIETRRAKLEADHPNTLSSMANLAATYWNQERWEEAEQLFMELIETRRAKLEADNPNTLSSMANLAATYWEQRRWGEAEQLFVKVVETLKAELGADHPNTLTSMANLAVTYRGQGRWEEAQQLSVKVIETRRAKLGANHPSTLRSIAILASTYQDQGRWEEAEQLFIKVLENFKAKLGADHPDTLSSMANLAWAYRKQGRWQEAEQLIVKVIETRRAKLGANHPSTLNSIATLASTYQDQGRWGEAEQLFVKVAETLMAKLGADHPDTLSSMGHLAWTYWNQGRWQEAEQLIVKVIETRRAKLGANHPSTLRSIAILASTYQDQGRWEEAEQLGVKLIRDKEGEARS